MVCIVGAFLYGYQTGMAKTETKYTALLKNRPDLAKSTGAYDQSSLVSFFHNVYAPYRDFQTKWFRQLNEIETGSGSVDAVSLLQELAKTAGDKYGTVQDGTMPESSPLLRDAQVNYLKSLKLFEEETNKFLPKANGLTGQALLAELDKSPGLKEAKLFALEAQQQYYLAIVKWNASVKPDLKGLDFIGNDNLTINQWNALNLNVKNGYTSELMLSAPLFADFTPQDLTARIDDMIKTGRAQKMNLTSVSGIIDVLMTTEAVRQGDFLKNKPRLYGKETLPLLPFFSAS
jgi:hypothetical protein